MVPSRTPRTIRSVLVGFDIEGGAGYRLLYFAWRHRFAIALGEAEERVDRRTAQARHGAVG
jgi:hypothetical protein